MHSRFYLAVFSLLILFGFTPPQPKKKILFFGDSITQQGATPTGFISLMDSLIRQKTLAAEFQLDGAGISGNKIYDLYLRMEDDVLSKSPDAVVIYIGINDVWHKRLLGTGTDPDRFEKFYTAIIKKLQQAGSTVYLCTPSVIGEKNDFTNPLDGDLNLYAGIVRNVADANNCALIDLRLEFLNYLRLHNPDNRDRGILTSDGVHLNREGNNLVAQRMLAVLGRELIN